MNAQKSNLRRKKEGTVSGLEGLPVSLEMRKTVGAGTHSKSWRERVPDFRSGNTEAADSGEPSAQS